MNKTMYIVIGLRSESELFTDGLIQMVDTMDEAKELKTNLIDERGCITVIITETKSFTHVINGKPVEHVSENRKPTDFFGGLVK
ncbi:hypothetical protein F373_gp216 [Bacillus phage SP-10]|uniref:hypothetical protein n=1 Tax=Bacillus phage SP10 TaxID=941058 RepID=UPI0002198BAC|nr:hypothetical protein [Bacillus subtilis]YP_007003473.1 hypothetical protein F373_gp216 [Bacillus phage SP-10]BAK53028.1 hypothetical protein [Bacillus phage SP-10]GLI90448.1 hypothetical protein ANABIO4_38000 [Bacillus subtilis]